MKYSTNYKIKLMEGTDKVKRQDFVDSFTTIDTQIKNIDNKHSAYGTTSGTNSYTVNLTGVTSYYDGLKVVIKIGTTCTGACSININNLGAKTILDGSGNAITSGSLKAGIPYNLCYNGTNFILLGKGGGGGGTATANQILSGQTATTNNGLITGTMPNNGAVFPTLNCSGTYTIPAGYHNGSGKITANNLASQTNATATAPQILSGQTAYVNGNKITGNMPNLSSNSSISYENGNSTKVIVGDQAFGPITNTDGTNRVLIRYNNTNGFVTGNTLVGVSTSNMASQLGITSDKIVAGNTICGVNGTATVQNVQQYKVTAMNYASGSREWNLSNVWTYPNSVLTAVGTFNVGSKSYSLYITAAFTEYQGVVWRKNSSSYTQIRSNGYYNTGSGTDYNHTPNNGTPYSPANALPIGSNNDFGSGSATNVDITVTCYRF